MKVLLPIACFCLSSVAAAEVAPVRHFVGLLSVDRAGERLTVELRPRGGNRVQLDLDDRTLASTNGLSNVEGRYVEIEGARHLDGRLKVVRIQPLTAGSPTFSDPLFRPFLPSLSELGDARGGYRGPNRSVYDLVRSGMLAPHQIASAIGTKAQSFAISNPASGGKSFGVRLYTGGDARHYYLASCSSMGEGHTGIQIEEIFEDRVERIGDQLFDRSRRQIPGHEGRPVWLTGETFTDPVVGTIRVLAATPANALVEIRPHQAANATVTNTADSGAGSLRNAITFHEANPTAQINFNIPISDPGFVFGVWTIKLLGPLPAINAPGTRLDGVLQRLNVGDTNHVGPEVFIDGTGVLTPLVVKGSGTLVRELGFINSPGDAITLQGDSLTVQRCFVGIKFDGETAGPNNRGINVNFGSNSLVGGDLANGNVVSGNTSHGIVVFSTSGARIEGNKVGTNAAGTKPVANLIGVELGTNALNATVGSTEAGHGNLLSGNTLFGLFVDVGGCRVLGNKVGVNLSATGPLPNRTGIQTANVSQITIGGSVVGAANLIAGNSGQGLLMNGTTSSVVQGNRFSIGAGGSSIPNLIDLLLDRSGHLTVGGSGTGEGNVLSSSNIGIVIQTCDNCVIVGNRIGTNLNVSANQSVRVGIQASNDVACQIGGTIPGESNQFGAPTQAAIFLSGAAASGNSIIGNSIGLNSDRSAAFGGAGSGIMIVSGASSNTVRGNTICGLNGKGIQEGGTGNLYVANFIGMTPEGREFGNLGDGILIDSSSKNAVIGSSNATQGNVICANAGAGISVKGKNATIIGNSIGVDALRNQHPNLQQAILVDTPAQGTIVGKLGAGNFLASVLTRSCIQVQGTATQNSIRANRTFSENRLPINLVGSDLGNDVTVNDVLDADTGPNNLMNFPELSKVLLSASSWEITGKLSTGPNLICTVDFYAVWRLNTANHGGAVSYVGSTTVLTDASGSASFKVTLPRSAIPVAYAATATDPSGNTSEFSLNRLP